MYIIYCSLQTCNSCITKYDKYEKSFLQNEEGYRDGRLRKTSETRLPYPIHRVPYPIPISLFLFIIGAEQDAAQQSGFMEDSYIKNQRYRDGVWNSMDGVWRSCFTSFS